MSTVLIESDHSRTGKGYPEPLVFLPSATQHTHSIIILHGRGSNAKKFGHELFACKLSCGGTLLEVFPSVKFIIPTAKLRRATVFKRMKIRQWFDNHSLEDPTRHQHLMYEGLQETTDFIHGLIKDEAMIVGVSNVVVGGLSQGCAAGLIAALSFVMMDKMKENNAAPLTLGGFFGMSGWLPFASDMIANAAPSLYEEQAGSKDDMFALVTLDGDDDLRFEAGTRNVDESIPARQLRAVNFVRDLVQLEPLDEFSKTVTEPILQNVPCFVGHGTADEKVSLTLGMQINSVLTELGLDVTWRPYYDFGHWYKVPEELDDIAYFLQRKVGMPARLSDEPDNGGDDFSQATNG